jgi:hypothetical protein
VVRGVSRESVERARAPRGLESARAPELSRAAASLSGGFAFRIFFSPRKPGVSDSTRGFFRSPRAISNVVRLRVSLNFRTV